MGVLSNSARTEAFALHSDKVWITCVTITHDDLAAPIRLCDNNEDVIRDVGTFTAAAMNVPLPGDDPENPLTVRLNVSDLDGTITRQIRGLSTPPVMTIETVLSSAVNTTEGPTYSLDLLSTDLSEGEITATFKVDGDLDDAAPGDLYAPRKFPGLF